MSQTKKQINFFPPCNVETGDLSIYAKVLSWAFLNFQLQSFLPQARGDVSQNIDQALEEVGYKGTCIKELSEREFQDLFHKESFFSSSQTGKRIVSYALKENGLKQNSFKEIENSITDAYQDVKNTDIKNELLEQSYRHCMDTLYVFKL